MKDSQPLFCWRNIMNTSYFQKCSLFSIFLVTFLTFTMPFQVLAATVIIGDVTTGEGGTMTFTANLDDNGNTPFTVDVDFTPGSATGGGTDFVSTSKSLSFVGTAAEAQTFTVTISDDSIVEANESFTVGMTNPSDSAVIITDTATGTIADNDTATVSIAANDPSAGEPTGSNDGQFTVTQTKAASTPTVISYTVGGTATEGTDYTNLTGSVTIAAGSTTAFIDVTVIGDTIVEASETVIVTLTATDNAAITVGAANAATVTIVDNDMATLAIAISDGVLSEAGADYGQLAVTLTNASSTVTSVNYTVVGTATPGTDYATLSGSINIPAGLTTAHIDVMVTDDVIVETGETVIITIAAIASGDADISLATAPDNTRTLTIADNDTATVTIGDISQLENVTPMTFYAILDNEVDGGFSVDVNFTGGSATGLGTDYDSTIQTLSFSSGTAGQIVSFDVPLSNESDIEAPSENFNVTMSALTPATVPGTSISITDTATGTILNDDHLITMSADVKGKIDTTDGGGATAPPDSTIIVGHNSQPTFTMATTDTCYHIEDVQVNGTSEGALATYTFPPVTTEDSTINLDTAINTYAITTTVLGSNGTLTADQTVDCATGGYDYVATANSGYHITWLKVNGVILPAAYGQVSYTYTFNNVTSDQTIEVAFTQLVKYADNSPFGSVTHSGDTTNDYPDGDDIVHEVDYDSSLIFTVVAADPCPDSLAHNGKKHHISDIKVDAVSEPGVKGSGLTSTTYTLSNIITEHSVEFLFTSYVDVTVHNISGKVVTIVNVGSPLTVTIDNNTLVSIEVESHENQLFTNEPVLGHHVSAMKIDGAPVGQPETYTFADMYDKDHTYEVWFSIDQFTLVPVSSYDTIFETSSETTKAVARTVDWHESSSYYVNLDDSAHSIQGVLVDNISYPIPASGVSVTYPGFVFTNVANNYLQVEFTSIEVGHRLEVLDFDTSPISDSPLDAKLRPKPASLMFTLDDSGSMDWEVIVPGVSNGLYNGDYYVYSYPNNNKARVYSDNSLQNHNEHNQWKSQWSGVNKMFYNPEANYAPWPTFTGTPSSNLPAVATNTDGYQTPEVATDNDDLAHANIYRPRYHPWRSIDCPDAIKLANGDATANLGNCNTTTYNNNTFNADATFLEFVDNTTIVQADNTAAVFTGTWGTSTGNPSIGSNYRYTTASAATDTATWYLTPASSGTYSLDAFWRNNNSRKTNVPYNITCTNCGGGGTSVTVDQKNNGGAWFSLGNFDLVAGETVTVRLTDNFNAASSSAADAVRIVQNKNIINAHYYTWADQNGNGTLDWTDSNSDNKINIGETVNEDIYLVNLTNPIEYYKVVDNTQVVSETNLIQVAAASLPTTVKTFAKPTDANVWKKERQNWADWFSYYRKRNLAATGAVAQVIARMSDIMVGFQTVNYWGGGYKGGGYGYSQSLLPVNVAGLGDETNRLLDLLYGFQIDSYGTPLRNGLYKVGQYCDDTDASTGGIANNSGSTFGTPIVSPFHAKEDGDECKQVFSIIMTDGYWNGGGPTLGNVDGDSLVFGVAPYADVWSNTLADVSMYFFEKDLSSMPNLVPDGTNTHQHMTTFSVAFGVTGNLVPEDYDFNPNLPGLDYPVWPQPVANTQTAVDDLWHVAVNGHGKFLEASRPDELVTSLLDIVGDIGGRLGSGASVSVNGDEMYESINGQLRMYQTSYNSGQWYGDLKAYALNTTTGEILNPYVWSAEEALADQLASTGHTARIIATYDGSAGKPFRWNGGAGTLNAVQQKQLEPYFSATLDAENVVDFLRGDSSNEGVFRDRDVIHPLGDMVNSVATYQDGFLYVGGNDGMLHAYYSDDTNKGKELFAYVPGQVYANLRQLANPLYQHRYFVDNSPYTKEISEETGKELTLLVGGLGKGGQGYYCLDITDASSITTETELASRVKWEYPAAPSTLLTGTTFTFTSATGTGGADQIKDSNKGFSLDKFVVGEQIAVVGANYNLGTNSGSNDGVYKIIARATDGSSIDVAAGSLTGTFGDGEDIIITKSTSDTGLGYSFSKVYLVETNDKTINSGTNLEGWVVIFGNGYDSEEGTASLYVLNPKTGALLKKIETNVGPFNGMSTPAIIDTNNDLKADYVYAGDLLGNMWKFDFTSIDHHKWQVAFCDKASSADSVNNCNDTTAVGFIPKPLFAGNANQPITGAPDVTNHSSDIGFTVVFGTGKYLGEPDLESFEIQSLYGIWDWAPDNWDTGYNGARVDTLGSPKLATLSNWPETDINGDATHTLLEQVAWYDGVLTEDTNGNSVLDLDEDINDNGVIDTYSYYRIISNYEGDFSTKATTDLAPSSPLYNKDISGVSDINGNPVGVLNDDVPMANVGWFFDLPGKYDLVGDGVDNDGDGTVDEAGERIPGERVTNDAIIRDGRAIFISFGVTGKRCNAGAYSFLIERNPSTGGMVLSPVYDLNEDGTVDSSDYVYIRSGQDENNDGVIDGNDVIKGYPGDQSFDGRLQNPAIVQTPPGGELKYLSTSQGAIQTVREKGLTSGVYLWQQIQ
jgi:Tfp pilus tip-associated adhesin PilY1